MIRIAFIMIGTAAMLALSLLRTKKYAFPLWKSIIIPFLLTISGVLGAMILYLVEQGEWGGISYYGSIMLIPLLMLPVSAVLRIKYSKFLDFAVPQICAMLVSMKVHCFVSGCCSGVYLYTTSVGKEVFFPSQMVEMILSLVLMCLFIYLENRNLFHGICYPCYFIIYGICRLILNFFRAGTTPFVWIIPAGQFWSLVVIIIGLAWAVPKLLPKDSNVYS